MVGFGCHGNSSGASCDGSTVLFPFCRVALSADKSEIKNQDAGDVGCHMPKKEGGGGCF